MNKRTNHFLFLICQGSKMSRKLTDFFQSCPKQVQKRIEKDNSKEISNSLNKEKPSECSSLTIPDCSTSLSQFVQFKPPRNFHFQKRNVVLEKDLVKSAGSINFHGYTMKPG